MTDFVADPPRSELVDRRRGSKPRATPADSEAFGDGSVTPSDGGFAGLSLHIPPSTVALVARSPSPDTLMPVKGAFAVPGLAVDPGLPVSIRLIASFRVCAASVESFASVELRQLYRNRYRNVYRNAQETSIDRGGRYR